MHPGTSGNQNADKWCQHHKVEVALPVTLLPLRVASELKSFFCVVEHFQFTLKTQCADPERKIEAARQK